MADARDGERAAAKPQPPDAAAARRERLALAMRANLKRRKAQQRGRERPAAGAEPVEEE